MCPRCHSLEIDVVELSGRGTLYSFAILHHPSTRRSSTRSWPPSSISTKACGWCRTWSTSTLTTSRSACRWRSRTRRPPMSGRCRSSGPRAVTTFAGTTAIVGVGADRVLTSRRPDRAAAGVRSRSSPRWPTPGSNVEDVDGLVSYTIDPVEETELVRSVGFAGDRLLLPGPVRRRRLDGDAAACGRRGGRRRRRASSSCTERCVPGRARPASVRRKPRRHRRQRTRVRRPCSGACRTAS